MEMIMSKLDVGRGVIMIHSLAGGTGSGLGSRIMENIRDEVI
jgi:Tubulin/FtsZ family, GTPase domain